MRWEFTDDRAIYSQIMEQVKMFIISGYLKPGDKIKSVRELASEAKVNPNTMQKALSELEREGLIFANRTSGRFITDDITLIKKIRNTFAEEAIKEFLENMNKLGISRDEAIQLIMQNEERNDDHE